MVAFDVTPFEVVFFFVSQTLLFDQFVIRCLSFQLRLLGRRPSGAGSLEFSLYCNFQVLVPCRPLLVWRESFRVALFGLVGVYKVLVA